MKSASATASPPRRSREQVESAVRSATLELAEQVPFKDLTIDEISRAAGISRTAFYFYFRGKHELLLAAMEEVADEIYQEADRWWHGEGEPETLIRAGLEGIVAVYAHHSGLLRVGHEVSTYDRDVGDLWRALVQRFVSETAEHLRREQAAGRLRPLDPEATAESLVWMMERCNYVFLSLGRRSPEQVVETLTAIWLHALYPDAS